MDKGWMKMSRITKDYREGVERFFDFAFTSSAKMEKILCPCKKCINSLWMKRNIVREHLIIHGILSNYTHWTVHGEASSSHTVADGNDSEDVEADDMQGMLNDIFRVPSPSESRLDDEGDESRYNPSAEAAKFYKYMSDADQELYPGCKTAKLSWVVRLFNLKCTSKWTNTSFDLLLDMIKEILPAGETLPSSFYETKKMVGDLGFSYEKIDACPNNCILYWKENSGLNSCLVCKASRWNTGCSETDNAGDAMSCTGKKVPAKQLRHFPLKPRLQRLFMSSKIADSMRWHHETRLKDGVLRHPADSEAWQQFDMLHPSFSSDPRNVRLGLSTDGLDPFRHGSSHSIWPVIVVVYNLPPWMCMKQPHFIMPLLIPGPKSPGNNIDVYMQPLIEELKELWVDGIETYDASSKANFTLRAALMWTISDFPAYAMLSGWSTKRKLACPCCQGNTHSRSLRNSQKQCYMGHRRYLEASHKYRDDEKKFDGEREYRQAPIVPSGFSVFEQIKDINVTFGRTTERTIPKHSSHNWRKKSIFFELPYWSTLLLRHNLDVIHIEKNVCDNLIGTLLGINGKTKDHYFARLDMQDLNIRPELHPRPIGNGKYELPAACFTMSKKEKESFLQVLKDVKVPDGYSSNISRCVDMKKRKISGLKSHDCHILIQQLLPIAIRGALPKHVCSSVIELCGFFRDLCSNNYRADDFERLEKKIALTLCHLEMIFPHSFFDIMVHLPIHLAAEARVAGPVQYRWMYPFERYMFKLKSYIRNKSHPEGSIAEGYIAEECLSFCSRYLARDVDTVWNRPRRNEDNCDIGGMTGLSAFRQIGRYLGTPTNIHVDIKERDMAHLYVLVNCEEVKQYINIWRRAHLMTLGRRGSRLSSWELDNDQKKYFPKWFQQYVNDLGTRVSEELKALARGPNDVMRRFNGYLINGYRFHTKRREKQRKTQNSGVFVTATTRGYSSASDVNPREEAMDFYGVLQDVLELDYFGVGKMVLFKCTWYDTVSRNGRGVKTDGNGFTLVNSKRNAYKDDPFVFPSQVEHCLWSMGRERVQDTLEGAKVLEWLRENADIQYLHR